MKTLIINIIGQVKVDQLSTNKRLFSEALRAALFIWLCSLYSCIDIISYDVSRETERLVISGQFTDELALQQVKVAKSVLTDKEAITEESPVDDAVVFVEDLDGNRMELTSIGDGRYEMYTHGETGKSYRLVVDYNNEHYASEFTKMLPKSGLPEMYAIKEDKEILNSSNNVSDVEVVSLRLNGHIEDNTYNIYRMQGEYEFVEFNPPSTRDKSCYVGTEIDLNTVKLISFDELRSNNINDLQILELPFDSRFFRMFCYHVEQLNIDKKTYDYWNKVRQVTNVGDELFDPPPGTIRGNISNINRAEEEVLGNFTVGASSKTRVFTNMTKLGGVLDSPCQTRFFGQPRPPQCAQCLILPNSTASRPPYWPL